MATYIHVDSRYRSQEPSISYHSITQLGSDPLYLTQDSSLITIRYANDLTVYDRISLNGIEARVFQTSLSIKKHSRYGVIVDPNHGLDMTQTGTRADYIFPLPSSFSSHTIIPDPCPMTVCPTHYQLKITGYLDGEHDIFVINEDTYAISLPLIASENKSIPVTISINYLYGIDLSLFSQILPIVERTEETVTISIGRATQTGWTGGDNIYLSHIAQYEPAYASPAEYVYYLHQAYYVNRVKLISTVFPNTQYVIREGTNTLLLETSTGVDTIVIPPGNYDLPSIASALNQHGLRTSTSKSKLHVSCYQTIEANVVALPATIQTNISTVIYRDALYLNGILNFDVAIIADFSLDTPEQLISFSKRVNTATVLIYLDNDGTLCVPHHDLKQGDYIITDKLSETVIVYRIQSVIGDNLILEESTAHILLDNLLVSSGSITEITVPEPGPLDSHTMIKSTQPIEDHVLASERHTIIKSYDDKYIVKGAVSGTIRAPRLFRFLKTPLKAILGIISNHYQYEFVNEKPIKLQGDPYIYLCCQELSAIKNTGSATDVLSIIKRREDPERILVDQHIPVTVTVNDYLDRLTISLRTPDNELVDVTDDHSFTLEIISD